MSILRTITAVAAAAVVAAPWMAPAARQQPPPPPAVRDQEEDARFRIRRSVELVVVPVTVKDAAGRLVHDIRRDEFRIFEDGVEQDIALFSIDPFPLSALILIDSNLPQRTAEIVREAGPAVAAGFSQFDEASVALFDLHYYPVLDFTADNDGLFDTLKRVLPGAESGYVPGQGSTAMTAPPRVNTQPPDPRATTRRASTPQREAKNLFDAVYEAARALQGRERERRKILFLVSDGRNSRLNTYTFEESLRMLLAADVSVYAIGVGDAGVLHPNNLLARYARQTGGDVFYARNRADLEAVFTRVAEQARNQYTLAYTPRDTRRGSEYRAIEVRVRRPGLNILTREGYYPLVLP